MLQIVIVDSCETGSEHNTGADGLANKKKSRSNDKPKNNLNVFTAQYVTTSLLKRKIYNVSSHKG